MLRTEYILAGSILVLVGIALCIVGYNEMRPGTLEQSVRLLQELSGEQTNVKLVHPNIKGYLFLVGGGLFFVGGILLILKSRKMSTTQP